MQTSLITKKKIAKSFKELLTEKEFDKISVSHIMENAGIRRQTFYNYFLDKFDLLEWIFQTDLTEQITNNLEYISGLQLLHELTIFFTNNRAFYYKLFLIVDQNDFNSYFVSYCRQVVKKIVKEYTTYQLNESLAADNIFISYHSYALASLIKNELLLPQQKAFPTPEQIITLLQLSFDNKQGKQYDSNF